MTALSDDDVSEFDRRTTPGDTTLLTLPMQDTEQLGNKDKHESMGLGSCRATCSTACMDEESAQSFARLVAQAVAGIMSEKFVAEVQKQLLERFAESAALEKIISSVVERTAVACAAMLSDKEGSMTHSERSVKTHSERSIKTFPETQGNQIFTSEPTSVPQRRTSNQRRRASPARDPSEVEFGCRDSKPTHRASASRNPGEVEFGCRASKSILKAPEKDFKTDNSNHSAFPTSSNDTSILTKSAEVESKGAEATRGRKRLDASKFGSQVGVGVKEVGDSISNKLLESMDLCPQPSVKTHRKNSVIKNVVSGQVNGAQNSVIAKFKRQSSFNLSSSKFNVTHAQTSPALVDQAGSLVQSCKSWLRTGTSSLGVVPSGSSEPNVNTMVTDQKGSQDDGAAKNQDDAAAKNQDDGAPEKQFRQKGSLTFVDLNALSNNSDSDSDSGKRAVDKKGGSEQDKANADNEEQLSCSRRRKRATTEPSTAALAEIRQDSDAPDVPERSAAPCMSLRSEPNLVKSSSLTSGGLRSARLSAASLLRKANERLPVPPLISPIHSDGTAGRWSHPDNMAKLRRLRTDEIVEDMRGSIDADDFANQPSDACRSEYHTVIGLSLINYLRIWGILAWRQLDSDEVFRWCSFATFYQWFIFLLTLVGLVICIVQVMDSRAEGELCYSDSCLQLGLFADIPLFVGAVVGLIALGTYSGSGGLFECIGILINYGQRQGFLLSWKRLLWRDFIVVCVVWVVAVLERIRGNGTLEAAMDGNLDAWGALHMIFFATSTGVLLGLTFCILFCCHAFTTMVDSYCVTLIAKHKLESAVRSWNILQAILRKSSAVIEACFFVLQTTAFSTILVGVADIVHSLASHDAHLITLTPCALVTLGVATIFFSAAKVSEKCARVPSLVNSMSFGQEIDQERQYVVEYITHSAAGFYVFEVRLTSAMSLKFTYFCVVAAFTLTTWLSTQVA